MTKIAPLILAGGAASLDGPGRARACCQAQDRERTEATGHRPLSYHDSIDRSDQFQVKRNIDDVYKRT